MISAILSRLVILVFGTLYPAYASYKAVNTRNYKDYVKWMMYWIVFALFTCIETFTDVFLSWFPFYYEVKIVLVIWLLSPATKGSSLLYRKFVHPTLSSREQEIDEYIARAKQQSYKQVLDLGSKGVSVIMQTAIKGGGGLVNQLKKSYSLSDLIDSIDTDGHDVQPDVTDHRLTRRKRSPLRSSSTTSASVYFSEVDVRPDRIAHLQSLEDISSGYSSGEGLYAGQPVKIQARESLTRTGSLTRSRTTRVTRSTGVPRKTTGSDDSDDNENEIFDTNVIFLNDRARIINKLNEDSSSETEFFDIAQPLHDEDTQPNRSVLTACPETKLNLDKNLITVTVNDDKSTSEEVDKKPRGGKYNKRVAPPPPIVDLEQTPVPPIKATLVLKPGLVRNLSQSSDNLPCKEIFINSPKTKRKTLRPSPSMPRKKLEPLTNFLKLPKKINFWSKENVKRASWHDFGGGSLLGTKIQSKSDNELSKREASTNLNLTDSPVSIRAYTESPLAKRRLKIIRTYINEDID